MYSETVETSRGYTGKGVATYVNGDIYDGYYKDGLRHGDNGTYTYNAHGTEEVKDTYKGSWADNEKNGIGIQIYTNVGRYQGYWKDGQRNGEGVMIYENEDIYSGQWRAGKKDGQGTYIFKKTGMKYVGSFKNGQMVNGKWLYKNGSFFQGNFDNNQPKGRGCWNFSNGNKVDGDYQQIKRADVEEDNLIKLSWKTTSDITKAV